MPTLRIRARSTFALLISAIFLTAGFAWADIVSPEVVSAWKRYESNPKAFDQTDQYCVDRKPGAACTIPGTAFEGGGAGSCERSVSQGSQYISLVCNHSARIEIDRQIPEGPFRADASLCPGIEGNPEFTCSEPPLLTDRFCSAGKPGQACMAEIDINGKKASQAGTCQTSLETRRFYFQGRQKANRLVLICEPANKAPERVYTQVSQWQKLLQW